MAEKIKYEIDSLPASVDQIKRLYLRMVNFTVDKQKDIIIVPEFIDQVVKIDQKGNFIFKKKFFGSKKAAFKNSLPQNHVYLDVETDKFNNIFILCGDYSSNPKKDIIVLTEGGNYLTTFTLPESTHMICIDHSNFHRCSVSLANVLFPRLNWLDYPKQILSKR